MVPTDPSLTLPHLCPASPVCPGAGRRLRSRQQPRHAPRGTPVPAGGGGGGTYFQGEDLNQTVVLEFGWMGQVIFVN